MNCEFIRASNPPSTMDPVEPTFHNTGLEPLKDHLL